MADEKRSPANDSSLEDTRREQFVQELLDSGRKSGEFLDARTARLPVIPGSENKPPVDPTQGTTRFTPIPEEPQPPEDSPDDEELAEFFDDLPGEPPAEPPEDEDDDWNPVPERSGAMPVLKAAIYIVCVLLGAVLLALGVWLAADDIFGLTGSDEAVTVTISGNESAAQLADMLKDAGLIKYKALFRAYCGLTHATNKIDPGVYELRDYYDYMALVNGMIATSSDRKTVTVTIPEGYEVSQILTLLSENGAADYDDLCDVAANYDFDYDFLAEIPYGEVNRLEGYLFPDTYEFYVDDDAETVLNKFLRNFQRKMTDDLYAQLDVLNQRLAARGLTEPLDLRDVLTVASMIEKEAATSGERTSIASVIYNRLCSNNFPNLQIDATVQYALGERKAVLTYDDLQIDSPYNTYRCEGLPAGPIACPGLSCIKAALYPADTSFYYYALDTDGTHHFSATRLEHEQFLASLEEGHE